MTADDGGGAASALPDPTPDEANPATYPPGPDDGLTPALPLESDAGATRALAALLGMTPFLDLHDRAGGDSVARRRICFAVDFLLRLVVVTLLVAVIALVVWKLLAPFPSLWE